MRRGRLGSVTGPNSRKTYERRTTPNRVKAAIIRAAVSFRCSSRTGLGSCYELPDCWRMSLSTSWACQWTRRWTAPSCASSWTIRGPRTPDPLGCPVCAEPERSAGGPSTGRTRHPDRVQRADRGRGQHQLRVHGVDHAGPAAVPGHPGGRHQQRDHHSSQARSSASWTKASCNPGPCGLRTYPPSIAPGISAMATRCAGRLWRPSGDRAPWGIVYLHGIQSHGGLVLNGRRPGWPKPVMRCCCRIGAAVA